MRRGLLGALRSRGYSSAARIGSNTTPFDNLDSGFIYIKDFLSSAEHAELWRFMQERGHTAVRVDGRGQLQVNMADQIRSLLPRVKELVPEGYLNNATYNLYKPGDFIRAHVDNLFFYCELFAILSLGGPARLHCVDMVSGDETSFEVEGGSLYLLSGRYRYTHYHYMPPMKAARSSIVLRRSILPTSGTFGAYDTRVPKLADANKFMFLLCKHQIGTPQMSVRKQDFDGLGPFDLSKLVKRCKPFGDFTLEKHVELDRQRFQTIRQECAELGFDPEWRLKEIHELAKARGW